MCYIQSVSFKPPFSPQDLDLDAFAEELERQGFGNKSITLYDIRAELNHKYKDLRTPYKPPNAEEVFNMLTKETPETFYIGQQICMLCTLMKFFFMYIQFALMVQ